MLLPRPKTVPIVAAFLFAASVISLTVAATLLFPNTPFDRIWDLNKPAHSVFLTLGGGAAVLMVLLGAGTLTAGIGLLHRKRWAWWFAVVLLALNGCGDAVNWLVTGDWFRSAAGVLVCSIFLYSLCRWRVRR
jgi:hypothetical protein